MNHRYLIYGYTRPNRKHTNADHNKVKISLRKLNFVMKTGFKNYVKRAKSEGKPICFVSLILQVHQVPLFLLKCHYFGPSKLSF